MTALQVLQSSKALPPPAKDNLPPTPPQSNSPSFPSPPPQLPPKSSPHHAPSPLSNGLRPPPTPIDIAATNELLGRGGFLGSFLYTRFSSPLDLNPGSGTPSPASPASPDPRARRTNPLVDLMETEKLYVDQLTGVIRVRRLPLRYRRHFFSWRSLLTESCFGMVAHESPSP